MRAVFGLAGLLITLGIIVWILKAAILPYNQTVIKEGNKAKEQAALIAGRDLETGLTNQKSITLNEEMHAGHLQSILVTDIIPNGPMAKNFGLLRNDSIVLINDTKVRDISNDDPELAKAWIYEASQRMWTLTVIRDGQQLTLPLPKPKPVAGAPPGAQPQPQSPSSPLQNQLDSIQKVPLH